MSKTPISNSNMPEKDQNTSPKKTKSQLKENISRNKVILLNSKIFKEEKDLSTSKFCYKTPCNSKNDEELDYSKMEMPVSYQLTNGKCIRLRNSQQSKSLYEWYEKLNLLPCNNIQVNNANNSNNGNAIFNISCNIVSHKNPYDDKNEDGYVRFFGINNNIINQDNGNYKHYIYLREQNDFDPSISGKIYQWKVNILCDSYLIGVGLADKNIVLENKNKFLSNDDKFNNGVFCLINTYNKNFNVKEIRPWNCDDKNAVNYVAVFPYFKKGREVTMEYDTDNMSLEFKIKKNSYSMKNIVIKGGKNIFTPCAIFYYSGDEIQFSKLTVVNK